MNRPVRKLKGHSAKGLLTLHSQCEQSDKNIDENCYIIATNKYVAYLSLFSPEYLNINAKTIIYCLPPYFPPHRHLPQLSAFREKNQPLALLHS